MEYRQVCQVLESISTNALLSHIHLSVAIHPFLTKAESCLVDAVWHRSSRFGQIGPAVLTYEDFITGNFEGHVPRLMLPMYPGVMRRTFEKAVSEVVRLGIIEKVAKSTYRIAAYPVDYLRRPSLLIERLAADRDRGEHILERLTEVMKERLEFVPFMLNEPASNAEENELRDLLHKKGKKPVWTGSRL